MHSKDFYQIIAFDELKIDYKNPIDFAIPKCSPDWLSCTPLPALPGHERSRIVNF